MNLDKYIKPPESVFTPDPSYDELYDARDAMLKAEEDYDHGFIPLNELEEAILHYSRIYEAWKSGI